MGGHLRGQAEGLAPGGTDSGGHLDHNHLIGIVQHAVDADDGLGIVPGVQGIGGTVGDALAAEGAVRLPHLAVTGDIDGGVGAGAHHVPDAQGLNLLAEGHAAVAANALALVPDDGQGGVPVVLGILMLVVHGVPDGQGGDHLLQLAGAVALAGGTVDPVLGQQQLQVGPAGFPNPGGVGMDDHTLLTGVVAGGDQVLGVFFALHLYHAGPAGTDFVDSLQEAEGGDGHTNETGCLQNGSAFLHLDRNAVDRHVYHSVFLPPLKIPQPK